MEAGQYHVSGFDSAVTGTRTITVSYTEKGVEKTAQFTVTITEKEPQPAVLERSELTKPAKVEYQVGEVFQYKGLRYQVTKVSGKGAFRNCAKLKSVIVKSKKVKSVKKNAFKGIHKKAVIKVPKSKRKAYARKLKKAQTNTITVR